MRNRIGLSLFFLLALSTAHAAPKNKVLAREAFDEGIRHYNLSEFKEALDSFKEAYRQYPDASFLFNIGQCQRQMGDKPAAIRSYKAFLRETPDAPNRAEVQSLIAALEKSVQEDEQMKNRPPQETMGTAAPPPPAEPVKPEPAPVEPAPAVVAQPPPEKPKKRTWVWGVVGGVVGVVVVGLAVGLGVGLSAKDPAVTYGSVRGN